MRKISLNGADWQFKGYYGEDWAGREGHLAGTRDVRHWHPGRVPGSVQHDLWQAGVIPDPYIEMNSLAIEWVPGRTWVYKKTFKVNPDLLGQRVQLVFQGVDYSARFYLNGTCLGEHTGMFLPVAFEVSELLDYAGDNLLAVVIDPAPFEQPQVGYTSKVYTQKARMNYWWDFSPRMINQGIWEDVFLRASGPVRLADVHVQPELAEDLQQAEVNVTIQFDQALPEQGEVEVFLRREGEEKVLQNARLSLESGQKEVQAHFHLDQPEVWWPNGSGDQPLYTVEVCLSVGANSSDEYEVHFGVRRVIFETNPGAAPDTLPYNLVVNGRKIYIKGWNWVPVDVLYGVEQPEKYARLLKLARNAHVNLLRVWGGGLIEKERFYSLCDQLGILVWQEFIQSSSGRDNIPSEDPDFIQFLVKNAETAIRARRNHPSLAVWCGGNELHQTPSQLCDDTHPALAALHKAVQRLDPGRHWLPTSPAGGVFSFEIPPSEEIAQRMQDVHGPWEYQGLQEQYRLYNTGRSLLHSEFGVGGLANRRTLNRTIANERQWPVNLNNPIWEHLGAWWVKERVWLECFGEWKDVDTIQRGTQFIQADGLRYAVEADRRRKYANGGSMPWQFNEPYPMAACTSAVDYYTEPKPVYYAVARAYQPLSLTARFDRLAWSGDNLFQAEIWCANSGAARQGKLAAQIVDLDGSVLCDVDLPVTCSENQAEMLTRMDASLEEVKSCGFFLDLTLWGSQGDLLATNRYLFSRSENLAPLLNELPQAQVKARVEKAGRSWQVFLENTSNQSALWVWFESEKSDLRDPGSAYFSDNYFCLLPGEQRQLQVTWEGVAEPQRLINVMGWNFTPVQVR